MMSTERASAIARALQGRTVACAESCTAGRLATAFAGVEEASSWFRGGIVITQRELAQSMDDQGEHHLLVSTLSGALLGLVRRDELRVV
jgi:nicotinamide-nucleotide amidase